MIIKAIAQICKTRKTAVLYDTDEIQWITDGYATYPLYKMPRFNEETLPTLLDIPEKKVKSYILRTDEFPKSLSRLDYEEEEEAIEEFDINIEYQSDSLIPFNTSHGLVFMDSTYLKPLKDMSEIRFFERETPDGHLYIAVKSGLLLVALIIPRGIITEEFVVTLKSLYMESEEAFINQKNREN